MKHYFLTLCVVSLFIVQTSSASIKKNSPADAIQKSVNYHLRTYGAHGAVVTYGNSKEIEFLKAFGTTDGHKKTQDDVIYDLASITKLFTAAALMIELHDQGLSHKTLVSDILPEYNRRKVRFMTLSELMRHNSGLRPGVGPAPYADLQRAWNFILGIDPEFSRGEFRYSDVNYLVLGKVLEKISGQRIDEAITRLVLAPMGMMSSGFLPMQSLPMCEDLCAPTVRGGDLGVAHDQTSRKLGGLAGHAGLFSTARDLSLFARAFLNNGVINGRQVIKKEIIELMSVKSESSERGLGFDISSPYSNKPRGQHFPKGVSFGHTGYTGTSMWIDPKSDTFLIILSNPVHSLKWQEAKKGHLKMIEDLANILGKSRA